MVHGERHVMISHPRISRMFKSTTTLQSRKMLSHLILYFPYLSPFFKILSFITISSLLLNSFPPTPHLSKTLFPHPIFSRKKTPSSFCLSHPFVPVFLHTAHAQSHFRQWVPSPHAVCGQSMCLQVGFLFFFSWFVICPKFDFRNWFVFVPEIV